jgi:predicted methyltransferase
MVRLSRNRLPNAKLINQPANYLKLKPESLDRVLFVQVYHDIYWHPRDAAEPLGDAQKVLANLRAALKPNGLVVVVEHIANETPRSEVTDIANRLHRIDPKIVREDFELAGFEFVGESTALRHPEDDHTRSVFSPTVRHRTDQFVYKFRKP